MDQAAARALEEHAPGSIQWDVACALRAPGEPWKRMFEAAKLTRPRLVRTVIS
jgi:hypothetical protein